ncbi:hypothetical protein [Agrobacterium salinitolerans]|uniref:Uncharacterized protein n=1 Tax=Agrobacterium salinitolerans TaxID=1183413 RepID=A0A9X3KNK8_9HYPH|nr:hypothetical protein [Agrobacterium salinitolerans]MCZ7938010.1 hypothetical protein [Agrobacterium salinitolerans]
MMDLNSRRRELNRLLSKQLSDFVVAAVPDHPLLMRGPDFLVGGSGILTAVFSPSQAEQKDSRLLANRLILSRLAMPTHTRNVLLLPEKPQSLAAGYLLNDFAAVFEWRDRDEIAKIARDQRFTGLQREIPKEIQHAARRQFSDVMQITSIMRYLDEKRRYNHDLSVFSRSIGEEIFFLEGNIASIEITDKKVSTKNVSKLINNQVNKSYILDSSIPYPSPDLYYGLAVVEELPEFRSDPDKLMRAAAFGGWAIITERQRDSIPALLKQLSDRRERRTQWR